MSGKKGKRRTKFSKAQILSEWNKIKDAPDEELTRAYAQNNYDWWSSAGTLFGEKIQDWYGFLSAMGKSEEEIGRIRKAAKRINANVVGKRSLKFSREEVLVEWEKIKSIPNEKLTYAYARENYEWFSSACTHFGKRNDDWYGFLSAMGKSVGEIASIRLVAKKNVAQIVGSRSLKYDEEGILAEWEKIKDAPDEELTLAYARENYKWWNSACTHFGKRNSNWYGFLSAVGKNEEEIQRIRKAGKRRSISKREASMVGKTSDGKTIVIVDAPNGNNGNGNGIDYSKVISNIRSPEIISTKTHRPKIVRFNMSLEGREQTTKVQSKAEEIRRMIGLGVDWNDPEFVKKYKEAFPQMTPWVVHRACILYLLGMAKSGKIEMPKNILSAASGPSEVHESFADLKKLFEAQGVQIPQTYDLDLSMNMLLAGDNRAQSIGDIRTTGFRSSGFDMVENSSIFQFDPSDVKKILIESNRITKEGGHLFLVSNGRKFTDSFYEGLVECGFELISEKDAMFQLDNAGRKLLEIAHGKKFSQKFRSALGDSVFILAKKTKDANQDVDENKFTFESFDSAPPELREFVDEFKRFLKGLENGDVESTNDHRRKAIAKFKDIGERKPGLFYEYRSVFTRAQAKFWSVVRSPKYSTYKSLEHLRDKEKSDERVFTRIWKTLPTGNKNNAKPRISVQ